MGGQPLPGASESRGVFATISVCHPRDIHTWETVARHLLGRIEARHRRVIVPDDAVQLFRSRSPGEFTVIAESRYADGIAERIATRFPTGARPRTGWYLQQLVKLRALDDVPADEVAVIWDADTVPLRRLAFVDAGGRIVHWKSTECHAPYAAAIERLLGMRRAVDHSFVAQCLAVRGRWVREFVDFVERRHARPWIDAVVDCIDFRESSGFSEYETLGTFVAHTHPEEMVATEGRWLRTGRRRIGAAAHVSRPWARPLLAGFDFASFEAWDEPYGAWKDRGRAVAGRLAHVARRLAGRPCSAEEFLDQWFARPGPKTVVQVGANDGEQNDPLRRFLRRPGDYAAILVEPLPCYADRLRDLYRGRADVTIVETALGAEGGTRSLHFLPPEVADEMDGDGPPNRWAHGQGSFDREVVAHWIRANSFRGEAYRRRLPFFLESIRTVNVPVRPTSAVMPAGGAVVGDVLLVIDVQGAELEVLRGVDWSHPPRCVVVEDDLDRGAGVCDFLEARGYRHECGVHDKVFVRVSRPT
jgi:FkbM family methyltransferase